MEDARKAAPWLLLLSLLVLQLFCYGTWNPFVWVPFSSLLPQLKPASPSPQMSNVVEDELTKALQEVSMENRSLIIAIVNKAYVEGGMLDLFLQSFKDGEETEVLLNHLLLIAVDQMAFNQCSLRHAHCYKFATEGVDFSAEKVYMSEDFIKMMWSRTLLLSDILGRGYNFLFTDMDVMWMRNPFARLCHQGEDLLISCDVYDGPSNTTSFINTGFYYAAANNRTIALFNQWYSAKNESEGMKEQDVLDRLIKQGVTQSLGLRVRFLDTLYFGGFCSSGKDFEKIVTIHSNCCIGIGAKIKDLRAILHGWIKYRGSSSSNSKWPSYSNCHPQPPLDSSNRALPSSNQTSHLP